jgi:uncharacterized membrane-anchored protein YjiN (DUF445 family)
METSMDSNFSKTGFVSENVLSVALLYELLQKQPLLEVSSEALLERGKQEKIQKQFAQAMSSLTNALTKSEQENNFERLLESIEHIGELFFFKISMY